VISIGWVEAWASQSTSPFVGSTVFDVLVVADLIPPTATVTRHVTVESPTDWVLEHELKERESSEESVTFLLV
jgi:hypothetical protein